MQYAGSGVLSVLPLLIGEDMDGPKPNQDPRDSIRGAGSRGVRAAVKVGSSSSGEGSPISDGTNPATPAHPFPTHDPEATLIDADATLVDAEATLADITTPPPARRGQASGLFVSAAVLQIGDVLGGRYEILQLLGEGGMGAVYKARDRELDRLVALKLIRPELASSPTILARFKQELLLAQQVTHKNVIRIFDLGEAEGVKFITMEYVEGDDLRFLLPMKGKFVSEEAVEIIRQICHALQAAHSASTLSTATSSRRTSCRTVKDESW